MSTSTYAEARDMNLGIKFVPSPNVRFMMDYVKTDFQNPAGTIAANIGGRVESEEKALLVRTQLAF